jgi:hypothetical protein
MVIERMWRVAAILAAVLMAGEAGKAWAEGREAPPARPDAPRARPGDPVSDEEMRAAIEQVMRLRLKRSLELTPEQEARVMPRFEKLQDERREFAERRRLAVSHLREMMNDTTASKDDLGKALREVRSIEESFRDRERSLRADIESELEPRQQARLYFFEERFRREMRRRFADGMRPRDEAGAGEGHGHGRRGAPGAPPADPTDVPGGESDL